MNINCNFVGSLPSLSWMYIMVHLVLVRLFKKSQIPSGRSLSSTSSRPPVSCRGLRLLRQIRCHSRSWSHSQNLHCLKYSEWLLNVLVLSSHSQPFLYKLFANVGFLYNCKCMKSLTKYRSRDDNITWNETSWNRHKITWSVYPWQNADSRSRSSESIDVPERSVHIGFTLFMWRLEYSWISQSCDSYFCYYICDIDQCAWGTLWWQSFKMCLWCEIPLAEKKAFWQGMIVIYLFFQSQWFQGMVIYQEG